MLADWTLRVTHAGNIHDATARNRSSRSSRWRPQTGLHHPQPRSLSPWDRGCRRGAVRVLRLLAGPVRDRHLEHGATADLALLALGGHAEQGVGARIEDEQSLAAHERPADADPRTAGYVLDVALQGQ